MSSANNKFNFVLEEPLLKVIFTIGWPIALSSVMQTINNLVDAFWLGKLGRDALSAPAISFQLIFFGISLGLGFSTAGTSLVSQYKGAGNLKMSRKTSAQLLIFIVSFSFLLSLTFLLLSNKLLHLISTPDSAFKNTLNYFRTISLGLPFYAPFFVYQSVMYGYGDSKSPLKILSISILINILLDPVLIFGYFGIKSLGVVGAAIATVLSNTVSSFIAIYLFFKTNNDFSIELTFLKPDYKIIKKIVKIGAPTALGMAGTSLGFIIVQALVNKLGTVVVAAAGIGFRMVHLFMLPAMGISTSVSTIVGQSIGKELYDRAKKSVIVGIRLIIAFLFPSMLLVSIYGKEIMKFFIPRDPIVQEIGKTMFQIVAISVIFFGIMRIIMGAFQGAGYTLAIMIVSFIRLWGVRIPVIWLLTRVFTFGHSGVWLGMLASNFFAALIAFYIYKKNRWLKRVI